MREAKTYQYQILPSTILIIISIIVLIMDLGHFWFSSRHLCNEIADIVAFLSY
jgi:hypothetical protein